MQKQGFHRVTGRTHKKFVKTPDGQVEVHLDNGEVLKAEKVLMAIGRPPLVEPLKLDRIGVEVDKRGAIVVDEF